ncbi:hypothetical protein Tco_0698636 [Tanacetum coccineum]
MVAFLSKPEESDGFEQIFWSTVKAKTVNGEVQLQALVDGKKIIVTEASVRSDLQQDDKEGMDCLPNATIFEELTRMSGPTTNVADEAVNEEMDGSLVRAATTASSLEAEHDIDGGPRHQETIGDTIAQTRSENVSKLSNDPLLVRGTSTTTTTIFSQPSQAKVQDKGKGILVEEYVKPKKKDLIRHDEEIASKLQAEFDEEKRLAREKDKANVALTKEWDDIQAKVDVELQYDSKTLSLKKQD